MQAATAGVHNGGEIGQRGADGLFGRGVAGGVKISINLALRHRLASHSGWVGLANSAAALPQLRDQCVAIMPLLTQ